MSDNNYYGIFKNPNNGFTPLNVVQREYILETLKSCTVQKYVSLIRIH